MKPKSQQIGAYLASGALCLMLGSVPLIYTTGIYEYALLPKRFALSMCVALAAFGWLMQANWGRSVRAVSSPLTLPALCFMGVALLSACRTTHPLDTVAELSYQAVLIALLLITANALRPNHLRYLLWTNVIAGLVVALIGISQYHNLAFVSLPTNGHPSATFGYRNFAAMYLVCAIPLSGLLFLTTASRNGALLSGLSTPLMGVYLVYTRTRGAWVGIGGALLVVGGLILLHPGFRCRFLEAIRLNLSSGKKVLLFGSVTLFILLAFLPERFQDTGLQRFDEKKANVVSTVSSIAAGYGDRGRLAMWANTLRLIAGRPLLGVGPGGWKRAYPPYDRGAMIRSDSSPKRPHNDYLWIASEHGLLGFGAYLWLLIAAFSALLALFRRGDAFWQIAAPMFAVSLLATFGHAIFSFPKEQPQAAMFPFLIIGIVAGATSQRRTAVLSPFLGVSALGLLLTISLGAAEISRRQIAFDGHYLWAILAEDGSDWRRMRAEAENALKYGAFRPHILVIKGRAEEKLRDYAAAETAYRDALARAPHAWHAHNGLGIISKRQGRFSEAFGHYQAALAIFPTATTVQNNLGALHKSMGDADRAGGDQQGAAQQYRLAEQAYRDVLRAEPDNAGAHNNLGNLYKVRGQIDSAAAAYQKALRADPDLAQAHFNLADLYRENGRLDLAVFHYQSAARSDSTNPMIYWGLGLALEAEGATEGAEAAYRKAMALRPNFSRAYFSLGNLLFNLYRYREAGRTFQDFIDLWDKEDAYTRFARDRLAECRRKAQ